MKKDKRQVSFLTNTETYDKLKEYCRKHGTTPTAKLNELIAKQVGEYMLLDSEYVDAFYDAETKIRALELPLLKEEVIPGFDTVAYRKLFEESSIPEEKKENLLTLLEMSWDKEGYGYQIMAQLIDKIEFTGGLYSRKKKGPSVVLKTFAGIILEIWEKEEPKRRRKKELEERLSEKTEEGTVINE